LGHPHRTGAPALHDRDVIRAHPGDDAQLEQLLILGPETAERLA
jgi:hypothetical protein